MAVTKGERIALARTENAPTTEKEMSPPPDRSPDLQSLDRGWFYHRGGMEHGPLAREALAETLRLMPSIEVLVWHPSLPDWVSPAEAQVRALIYGARPAPDRPSGLISLLFSFEGRLGRARYLWSYCLSITPYILVVMAVLASMHVSFTSETGTLVRLALAPPFVWIGLALTAKRLHDIDLSALHLLWVAPLTSGSALVPPGPISLAWTILSCVCAIWLLTKRGTTGPNHYGPDPLPVQTGNVVVTRAKQGGGLNVLTLLTLLILVSGSLYYFDRRSFDGISSLGRVSCSQQGVQDQIRNLETTGPRTLYGVLMFGGEKNIRLSMRDIRTSSYDRPINGVTCAATLVVMPIDFEKSAVKSGGTSEVTYSVQSTDANDGRYVVTILSD